MKIPFKTTVFIIIVLLATLIVSAIETKGIRTDEIKMASSLAVDNSLETVLNDKRYKARIKANDADAIAEANAMLVQYFITDFEQHINSNIQFEYEVKEANAVEGKLSVNIIGKFYYYGNRVGVIEYEKSGVLKDW